MRDAHATVNVAVFGSGKIVAEFLEAVASVPGLDVGAIVGRAASLPKLEAIAAEHGIPKIYTDADDCLADAEIDTVYIALPNHLHAPAAAAALRAGKHVICEKPFTLRSDELAELRALAEERDLMLVEAITTVDLANYRAIRERLPDVGALRLVQCEYSQLSSRFPAFEAGETPPAFDPSKGGGALMDIGIYTLHFIVGLLGRPDGVSYTANIERGVDTSGVAVLRYEHCTAIGVCAKDSGGPNRTKIQGTAGAIVLDGAPNTCERFTVVRPGQADELVDLTAHPHRMVDELRAFQSLIARHDTAERDRRLDHSQLVLALVSEAAASAGLRLGDV